MRPTAHSLTTCLLPLLLTGCSGTVGTLAWRSWNDHGTKITEVRSVGFELRSVPGYRGISLGQRITTYVNRLPEQKPEKESGWGFVSIPHEAPLFTQSITVGSDLAYEPSYIGMTVGATSRSCAILDLDTSSILKIRTSNATPSTFYYQQLP